MWPFQKRKADLSDSMCRGGKRNPMDGLYYSYWELTRCQTGVKGSYKAKYFFYGKGRKTP